MLLRHYLEQGVSKSALARQLGISRDTIERGSCWMCRWDQPRRHRVAGQAALSAGAA